MIKTRNNPVFFLSDGKYRPTNPRDPAKVIYSPFFVFVRSCVSIVLRKISSSIRGFVQKIVPS